MPKIKFSVNFLSSGLKRNVGLFFLLMLLALFALEGYVLNKSLQTVLHSDKSGQNIRVGQGVRFDFKNYEEVVKRIKGAADYLPQTTSLPDPFTSSED